MALSMVGIVELTPRGSAAQAACTFPLLDAPVDASYKECMSRQATHFFAEAQAFAESLRSAPGAAFAEPWQARAFAIAVMASRQGCFTWSEWTHALGQELQRSSETDPKAVETNYFDCWLSALQSLLLAKGSVGQAELHERKHAWEDAYRRTPHGVPVSLSAP